MDKHPLDSNPNPINQSQSQFPSHTPPVHQMEADDDDENVKQLKECSALYLSLQDCLVQNNRNWKSCQKEVGALKACNERRKK
ncbi:uncharacterized protein LOC110819962 [Carica papaya]|uniref:uncharacterized protein LOC110819962 n=1 Tax=Carica papaya TaxID=3649 RepID=UPI000B8CF5F9|nr:uncharacterized protein LOC110819962 [Carica papaya]